MFNRVYTEQSVFSMLLDIDGCVATCCFCSDSMSRGWLKSTIDMMKPGAHIALITQLPFSIEWTLCLENGGITIKDQIGVLSEQMSRVIVLGMKPYEKSYAHNALVHDVAGINIDKMRIGEEVVGWNGLGRIGKTWNKKTCGLRNEQEARPVSGRFPCNMIFTEPAAERFLPKNKDKFFHSWEKFNWHNIIEHCIHLIAPPNNGLLINPFDYEHIFADTCAKNGQKYIAVAIHKEKQSA